MRKEHWSAWGFLIPTAEYVGGTLAGVGLGVFLAGFVLLPPDGHLPIWLNMLGFGCIGVGSLWARSGQRKRFQMQNAQPIPKA